MLTHISKLLTNDQVLKTIILSVLEDDSRTEPTVDEVFDFGESIKLPRIELQPGYPHWFNALHEVGHWAVKPEWFIEEWQKPRERTSSKVPALSPNHFGSNVFDSTPNELGVRAWSFLVLAKKHWRFPPECYPEEFAHRGATKEKFSNNPYMQEQWDNFYFCKGEKPINPTTGFSMNGLEQLKFAGIDIERDIYRPDPQFGRRHFIHGVKSNRIEKYAA